MKKELKFAISRSAVDQHGGHWIEVVKSEKTVWISISQYAESDTYGTRRFGRVGVALLTAASKQEAKAALEGSEADEEIFAVAQPGFVIVGKGAEKRVIGYAYASGELIGCDKPSDPEVIIGFEPHPDFGKGGDLNVFQAKMAPLIKKQALPILMLTAAIAPILQQFTPPALYVENMVIDLCGKGTRLKSAIAVAIAGPVWGSSDRKTGFLNNGNATPNKIERTLPMYNNALAGRDETTMMGDDASARGKALGNLVHRISAGTVKERIGDDTSEVFRLIAIFSSNQGLWAISTEDTDVLEALETRIVTIVIPERPTGAYDFLPEGHATTRSIQEQLYTIGLANYGHIARLMIAKTLDALHADPDGLTERIGSLMKRFMDAAGQARLDDRRVRCLKLFALCYASGIIAKEWGVLDKDLFGAFREPLLRAWAMANSRKAVDDREGFFEYLRKHADEVIVIDRSNRPETTDKTFSMAKAYILPLRDGQLLACFPAHRMPKRFPGFEPVWKRLREKGQIVADSGLQSGQRIRLKDGVVCKDKVYALRIDSWPLE